jgi:nicotinate-nucleotide adenylyltransferase
MKRIAFYGGSFDPLHSGHLTIARNLTEIFELDEFVFVPAFQAPHKSKTPVSPFHRFAMLALATGNEPKITISKIELEAPERPYTVETLTKLKIRLPGAQLYFVMGADSWKDITTWREWEKVLTLVDIIVVTRPGYEIGFSHVTEKIRNRIVDLRGEKALRITDFKSRQFSGEPQSPHQDSRVYISDSVLIDVSATEIRRKIKENIAGWREDVPSEVAKYIEKYELYI